MDANEGQTAAAEADNPVTTNADALLETNATEVSEPRSEKKQTPPPPLPPPAQAHPNMGIPVQYNQFPGSNHPSRNGSPVIVRPASAMSTTSTASYLTATTANTAVTSMPRYNAGNANPIFARGQHPGQYPQGPPGQHGHYQQHPAGNLPRPTGRYPLPPHRGAAMGLAGAASGHPLRPVPTRMGGGVPQGFAPQRQGYPQHHYGHGPPSHQDHHHQMQYHQQFPQDAHVQDQASIPPPPPIEKMEENENQDHQNNRTGSTAESPEDSRQEQPSASQDNASQQEQSETTQEQLTARNRHEESAKIPPPQGAPLAPSSTAPMNGYGGGHGPQNMQYGGGAAHAPREQQQFYQQPFHQAQQQQYHNHHQAHVGYGYGQQGHSNGVRYGTGYHYNEGPGGLSPPPHYQQHYQQQQYYSHNEYAAVGPHGQHHQGHYAMPPQDQHYARHATAGMPPTHHHQGGFQLPHYNNAGNSNPSSRRGSFGASPETTVDAPMLGRSPSPPPRPPAASATGGPGQPSGDASMAEGSTDAASVDTSKTKAAALGEREQNTNDDALSKAPSVIPTKSPGTKKEDATADAASILLALGMQSQKGGSENENLPQSVQGSRSMDDASEMTHPDLTSEPSNDSMERSQTPSVLSRVIDSEFPCPIPAKYPTRLCLPYDGAKLNSLHCFLRSELLEIFVVKKGANKSPTHSPHSSVGRVGLRCVHCAMNKRSRDDRDEAPMAVFYPKSVAEIYRLVTSWQRCHLRKCKNLPPAVRTKWQELRETDKSRGKTHYWVTAAKEIGLRDCQSRAGGIRFAPDLDASQLPPQTRVVENDIRPMDTDCSKAACVSKNFLSGDPPGSRAV